MNITMMKVMMVIWMNELLSLFLVFLRIDLVGFGGGYAMLPLIFQSVQDFGMMTASEFANLVALSQVTPGPIAINAATYVGFNSAGVVGAIFATFGIVLPSFILVYIIAHFLDKFKESSLIESAFSGIRPATVGLVGSAIIFIGESSLFNDTFTFENIARMGYDYIEPIGIIIFIIAIIVSGKFKVNPIIITLLGGAAGVFLFI